MTQSPVPPLYIFPRDECVVMVNVIEWCTSTYNVVVTQLMIYIVWNLAVNYVFLKMSFELGCKKTVCEPHMSRFLINLT
jgi:hypothetical protein